MAQFVDLGSQAIDFGFECHHTADAFEVHSFGGEFADAAEPFDVDVGVAPVAALGACRLHQTAAFVDAQRLRVHAGQFGSNGDHIHGVVA